MNIILIAKDFLILLVDAAVCRKHIAYQEITLLSMYRDLLKADPVFGEFCCCCCLLLLPGLANSIHATWDPPSIRALYLVKYDQWEFYEKSLSHGAGYS